MDAQWALGLALCVGVIGYRVGKDIHWSLGAWLAWVLLNVLWVSVWRHNQYAGLSGVDRLALADRAAVSGLSVVVLGYALCRFSSLLPSISVLCFVDSLYVIGQAIAGLEPYHRGGFLNNASMNACFIAFTYPLLALHPRPVIYADVHNVLHLRGKKLAAFIFDLFCVVAPIVAVFLSGSSMAVLTLAVVHLVHYYSKSSSRGAIKAARARHISAIASSILTIVIGYLILGKDLFGDSGRFAAWKLFMEWWATHANVWIGAGQGSFVLWATHLQTSIPYHPESTFPWMHNDFLQVLFELGWIGLTLTLCVIVSAFKATIRSNTSYLTAALAGLCVTALGNYPFHLMLTAMTGASILLLALASGKSGVHDERSHPSKANEQDQEIQTPPECNRGTP